MYNFNKNRRLIKKAGFYKVNKNSRQRGKARLSTPEPVYTI
jgi:hypothetical protein